ncbi:MAG: hypothetical protein RIR33_3671 [Pseudomonadota bacterium]|jgi:carbon monoxide dehydrogenase subunit G
MRVGGEFEVAERGKNWFVEAPGDIQRIEACLTGVAFAPHRHDTYTIGVTLGGRLCRGSGGKLEVT